MIATIDGVNLYYVLAGQGQPLVLIHAFPLDHRMWCGQLEEFSRLALILAPDLRGFGKSDAPPGPYTMDRHARDVVALMDVAGMSRAVIAGVSMGGYVALAIARLFPERMRGLILCDTRAGSDTTETARARRLNADRVQVEGVGPVLEPLLPKLLSKETRGSKPEVEEFILGMIRSARPAGVAGALLGLAERPDSFPLLPGIRVPTLIVVGDDDIITPPADAHLLAEHIAGAKMASIARSGHLPNLEQPEHFNREVQSFLESLFRA